MKKTGQVPRRRCSWYQKPQISYHHHSYPPAAPNLCTTSPNLLQHEVEQRRRSAGSAEEASSARAAPGQPPGSRRILPWSRLTSLRHLARGQSPPVLRLCSACSRRFDRWNSLSILLCAHWEFGELPRKQMGPPSPDDGPTQGRRPLHNPLVDALECPCTARVCPISEMSQTNKLQKASRDLRAGGGLLRETKIRRLSLMFAKHGLGVCALVTLHCTGGCRRKQSSTRQIRQKL